LKTQKVLITSALPYANGPLHFGHLAGAYLPGDAYARFKRLQGCDVLYLCGSDEYGVAITLSAEMVGRTPKEQVDHFHEINKAFFTKLNFSFDHYSRTTWEGHPETVQAFFLDLLANGHIEEKVTKQLFSEKEQRFLADRYVQGMCPKCAFPKARGDECQSCGASYEATDLKDPVSKITGSPLVLRDTKHWFLRFDHFAKELQEWIKTKPWKSNVLHFAESYLQDLRPRAITRDAEWGVPVPLEEAKGKVLYVWFDAPIGYISAAKEWAKLQGDPELWKKYWLAEDTELVQFIGKDNIPFHAIFFPAMILGQNTPYKKVDQLPANEFYNLEGRQFSKSESWTIDLETFFHRFSTDQIRYAIASNAPETGDSEFSWKDFQARCNAELLGKYGNFIHRVLIFIRDRMGGVIPSFGLLKQEDKLFLDDIQKLTHTVGASYESFSLRKACQHMMELAQRGNIYFDAKKPWLLAKDPDKIEELKTVLRSCLECIKLLALTSFPIIPASAEKVWQFLGFATPLYTAHWENVVETLLVEGTVLREPHTLFQKVEDEVITQEIEALHKNKQEEPRAAMALKESIALEDFQKVDLRVGKIEAVERVPKSKKLLKLLVDIGVEKRTVVAGIGEGLQKIEALLGQSIVIVANLKPAKLMGIESQGMLLAAKGTLGLEPISLVKSLPGDVVS